MRGGRFNPKGVPALYLSLSIMTAIKEANQGFAHRIDPCVLCSYDIDCEDIADLTTGEGLETFSVTRDDLASSWALEISDGKRPQSWEVHDRLRATGIAGIVVPSFAPGAEIEDRNLVLWDWGADLPHKASVFDPSNRLPKDQLSWT